METTTLYKSIADFLQRQDFKVGTNDSQTTFTRTFSIPGRQMIINGQQVTEQPKPMDFVITSLGRGTMYNVGEEEEELQGFNMAGSDIWVNSLEDFKFWLDIIFKG